MPQHSTLVLTDADVDASTSEHVGRLLHPRAREALGSHGDDGCERRLDDLDATGSVGLEVGDAAGGNPPVESSAKHVHVLEAVEQRHDHSVGDRARIDALDRILESRRLHGHQQEVDGLREVLGRLDAGRQRPLG